MSREASKSNSATIYAIAVLLLCILITSIKLDAFIPVEYLKWQNKPHQVSKVVGDFSWRNVRLKMATFGIRCILTGLRLSQVKISVTRHVLMAFSVRV
jgi:hypothetical protein